MPNNYIFIDYENVHPDDLEPLNGHEVEVLLFVGAKQPKIPTELATSMQSLGYNARYVVISDSGPNALDFHIAYYLGELAAAEPEAYFHIISRDKGFDPLISHLRARKTRAHRHATLLDLPFVVAPSTPTMDDMVEKIVQNLAKRGPSRPRKHKTLNGTVGNLCANVPGAPTGAQLVAEMKKRHLVEIADNGAVTYRPPISKR